MPSGREVRFQLDVLNMRGETLSSIEQRIYDGQVNVATDADGPTRLMPLSLYDPLHRLQFDSDAPTDGLSVRRMLRAWYGVRVPTVGWVDTPVFTGPMVMAARDGDMLNVECQGKEERALQSVWDVYTVEAGVKKTDAIRRIMRDRAGETDFDIPDLPTRLGEDATLTPEPPDKRAKFNANTPWALCQEIARSMGRQLFYDGRGRLRLRLLPGTPVFTFEGSLIQTEVSIKFDRTRTRNAVKVTGKTLNEGKEKKGTDQVPTHVVRGHAVAKDDHPLSPGLNGLGWLMPDGTVFRRYLPEYIVNDAVRSDREATRLAHQILEDRLAQQIDVAFDALPVPPLEELDLIRVKYEDMNIRIRAERFTIPLTHAGVMSVGDIKRVTDLRRG